MVQISVMLLLPRNWRQSSEEILGECEGVPAAMCQKRDSWLDMMWPRVLALQGEKQQVVIEATISRQFWNQYRVAWFENRRVLWTYWLYQTLCRVGQSTFHKLIFVGPQYTWGMTSDMLKNAHKISESWYERTKFMAWFLTALDSLKTNFSFVCAHCSQVVFSMCARRQVFHVGVPPGILNKQHMSNMTPHAEFIQ